MVRNLVGFYCCEVFPLKALSSGEYFSTLMTKFAKVGTVFGRLGMGLWGQPCEALYEADLSVLWSHLVAKERRFLASRDHWSLSLLLTGPRERIQKVPG